MGKGSKWRETDFKKYFDNYTWEKNKKNEDSKEEIKVVDKKGKKTYIYK